MPKCLSSVTLIAVISAAMLWTAIHGHSDSQDVQYDKELFAKRLNLTIDFCQHHNNERCALRWINKFGQIGDYFTNILNRFSYAYSNRIDKGLGDTMLDLSAQVQRWGMKHLKIARRFPWRSFKSYALRRRFQILTEDMTLEDDAERLELSKLQQSLMEGYSRVASCPDKNGPCLPAGEQAVSDVMAEVGGDYNKKQAVWRSWYDTASKALRQNFTRYVALANKGARSQGFADAGSAEWRLDFESNSFDSDVLAWYDQLSDLYRQLHAYVRHRLSLRHPGKFDPAGCLPAHILGRDQWAQQWYLPLSDFPHPERVSVNYSELLQRRFGNFSELVRASEEFYTSLGMAGMTKSFWRRSSFLKPSDPAVLKDCHASAWDFASRSDFRIKMCGRISQDDFYVIHHEMGHIEYFMAYSQLPREFRNGANSGFHEAVGDTMALSVNTMTHYATLGLVNSSKESTEEELNSLFAMAMEKVPFLPFALSTGVFRWLVFNGTAGPSDYNRAWWTLRARYGGVSPPVDRPVEGFDAGAKYHVALDISYIRYYFSFILQFQLHRRMCQLSGQSGRVNQCDFYRSRAAGRKFWKMLQIGCSRPWQEILKDFTGQEGLQTSGILEYFKPLHNWLSDYNRRNNVPVGWKMPDDVLKGVSR